MSLNLEALETSFDHIAPRGDELRSNIEHKYYEAGHMMYVHEPTRRQQSRDLAAFVTRG